MYVASCRGTMLLVKTDGTGPGQGTSQLDRGGPNRLADMRTAPSRDHTHGPTANDGDAPAPNQLDIHRGASRRTPLVPRMPVFFATATKSRKNGPKVEIECQHAPLETQPEGPPTGDGLLVYFCGTYKTQTENTVAVHVRMVPWQLRRDVRTHATLNTFICTTPPNIMQLPLGLLIRMLFCHSHKLCINLKI